MNRETTIVKLLVGFGFYAFLLIALPLTSVAQFDTVISYSEVIQVPEASKDQLFYKGRQWFNDVFRDSKEVLQIADKETGELSGKGNFDFIYHYRFMKAMQSSVMQCHFLMNVWVKDGKYKYEITDLEPFDKTGASWSGVLSSSPEAKYRTPMVSQKKMNEYLAQIKIDVDAKVREIISSLKDAMEKTSLKGDF